MSKVNLKLGMSFWLALIIVVWQLTNCAGGLFSDSVTYKLTIGSEYRSLDIHAEANDPVVMYNKKGQPFHCFLPEQQEVGKEIVDMEVLSSQKLSEIFKPSGQASKDCIRMITNHWWSYEFCYSGHVVQMHMKNNYIIPPIVMLGTFSHDFNWTTVPIKQAKENKNRFHTQFFVNGSICDLNGRQRETRVKIYCDEQTESQNQDSIISVGEPETCVYEVVVYSRRLCQVYYFRKMLPVIGHIACNPTDLQQHSEEMSSGLESETGEPKERDDQTITISTENVQNPLQHEQFYSRAGKSHARSFGHVIAEMNPKFRKRLQLQNLILKQLEATGASVDEIQFIQDGIEDSTDDLKDAELNLFSEQAAEAIAKHLQDFYQQTNAAYQLEQNYNYGDKKRKRF